MNASLAEEEEIDNDVKITSDTEEKAEETDREAAKDEGAPFSGSSLGLFPRLFGFSFRKADPESDAKEDRRSRQT